MSTVETTGQAQFTVDQHSRVTAAVAQDCGPTPRGRTRFADESVPVSADRRARAHLINPPRYTAIAVLQVHASPARVD